MHPKGHGESILVVDDEAAIREVTSGILEINGYRVITAGDGAEALAMYIQKREEIKVVLMDMIMPVMDGPESIQELRKVNPAVKIIIVSGMAKKEKLAKIADFVHAFLPKPYTIDKLLNIIHEVLLAKNGETSATDKRYMDSTTTTTLYCSFL